jgi:hypothetical protein
MISELERLIIFFKQDQCCFSISFLKILLLYNPKPIPPKLRFEDNPSINILYQPYFFDSKKLLLAAASLEGLDYISL